MSVYYKENAEYFDQALESNLINQTLKPDEFILVCDGDIPIALETVISKYQLLFPKIIKVFHKENGGLGKALRFGLTKCSFPLIARSDSDDICCPTRFEKQVRYLSEHTDIGIISSHIDEFITDWNSPINLKEMPTTHSDLYEMAKFRNPLNHMAVMMRKDEIIRIGSYRHLPYIEDYELWIRALNNGIKIGNIGEVLVHARTGNGMIQRRGSKKYIKSWHILNYDMINYGMISFWIYLRNMIAISAFVFIPVGLKKIIYKNLLRKE